MEQVMKFLADEEELLADFLIDMENAEGSNKAYAQAVALWSMQSARVGAIRDVIEMMGEDSDN